MQDTYNLPDGPYNSEDRGNNVGWKIDMNAHMARYTLLLWEAVLKVRLRCAISRCLFFRPCCSRSLQNEGINRTDWLEAARLSAEWIYRMGTDQVAAYGGCEGPVGCAGFPQCIMASDDTPTPSVVSGRTMNALPVFQVRLLCEPWCALILTLISCHTLSIAHPRGLFGLQLFGAYSWF